MNNTLYDIIYNDIRDKLNKNNMTKVSKFRCDDCNDCGKPIEFLSYSNVNVGADNSYPAICKPYSFVEVVLMQLGKAGEYDQMWAISKSGLGTMYLGYWNDGFVD